MRFVQPQTCLKVLQWLCWILNSWCHNSEHFVLKCRQMVEMETWPTLILSNVFYVPNQFVQYIVHCNPVREPNEADRQSSHCPNPFPFKARPFMSTPLNTFDEKDPSLNEIRNPKLRNLMRKFFLCCSIEVTTQLWDVLERCWEYIRGLPSGSLWKIESTDTRRHHYF